MFYENFIDQIRKKMVGYDLTCCKNTCKIKIIMINNNLGLGEESGQEVSER